MTAELRNAGVKIGVLPADCLFIDDIPAYLEPARAKGMAVWHHQETPTTVQALRKVFASHLRK